MRNLSMLFVAHNAVVMPSRSRTILSLRGFSKYHRAQIASFLILRIHVLPGAWVSCAQQASITRLHKHALSAMWRKWASKAISVLFLNRVACKLTEHLACTEGPVCERSVGMPCC